MREMSLAERGLETQVKIKRGEEWAAVIETATMVFNWVNHPCVWKAEKKVAWSVWGQTWEYQTQNTGLIGTEKANWKVLISNGKKISTGKSMLPKWTGYRYPECNQEDSQMQGVSLPAHLYLSEGMEQGNSKCPSPRGNSVPAKNLGRDEVEELENSAKAKLCYPGQICPKITSYWTNERPVFLSTCMVQNQHMWVKWL